ncbi:MAG: type III pantothenate kinase [Thermodesulfovibrionales bacterium]|nr:type III pantothenate kinase [Thermodesulfovibrionales bacterium]
MEGKIADTLLAVDIGNSTIGLALFHGPLKRNKLFIKKIPTHPVRSVETYKKIVAEFIKNAGLQTQNIDTVISSVVPSAKKALAEALTQTYGKKPLVASYRNCKLAFHVARPKDVGRDRIANAVAGYNYFKKPVAVIDFGTATTIAVVGKQRDFIGGAILPGIDLMQKALRSGTAKLPLVSPKRPKTFTGDDTASSIMSGIIYGTIGAIDFIIKGIEKEIGYKLKLAVTGGYAELMSPLIKRMHILSPNLTFEGLRLIYLGLKKPSLEGKKHA